MRSFVKSSFVVVVLATVDESTFLGNLAGESGFACSDYCDAAGATRSEALPDPFDLIYEHDGYTCADPADRWRGRTEVCKCIDDSETPITQMLTNSSSAPK